MLTLVEKREKAAILIKEAKDLLDKYPDEVPKEVAEEIGRKTAEYQALSKEIREKAEMDETRNAVSKAYSDHFDAEKAKATNANDADAKMQGKGGFPEFADFLRSVYIVGKGGRRDPRLVIPSATEMFKDFTKDLEEGTGSAGGFLVPTDYSANLLTVAGEGAIVRPRATVVPIARRQVDIPALDYEQSGTKQSAFFGGVVAKWTEESGTKEETEPKFRKVQLVAHKLAGYTPVEDELLEDSAITVASLLTTLFGGAIRWHEDYAFLQGDGVGKPIGVLNAPVTIVVVRQAAGQVQYLDIVNMLTQLLPGANPVWVTGADVLPQLLTMQDPNGNYIYHPAFGIAGAAGAIPATLMGYPVIRTEKLPALGATGDVMLADFRYYLLGDRKGITIAYSTDYLFRYDETAWRFVSRVDGQPWLNAPITLRNTLQVSPFVVLGEYT